MYVNLLGLPLRLKCVLFPDLLLAAFVFRVVQTSMTLQLSYVIKYPSG
jgi:integral membrane sensor domain MASE1